jgi:hypothetical protein
MTSSAKAWTAAATQLTDRDRYQCRLLFEHDVLTTPQIGQIVFSGERRTRQRLALLSSLSILESVRPRPTTGSFPQHWLLGPLGARAVAADTGLPVETVNRRRSTARSLILGQRCAHQVGTNGVFTALLAAGRSANPSGRLDVWWSARRCAAEYGYHVRPDGYGEWTPASGGTVRFLLEYDAGTERLHRLAGKLDGYAGLAAAAGRNTLVLFTFPTARREHGARTVLAAAARKLDVPVATAIHADDPAGPAWLPLNGTVRQSLNELPLPGSTPRWR